MFCASMSMCVCVYVCVLLTLSTAQLSESDHQTIVEQHNILRGLVEPRAVFMRRMIWDDNLKIVAEGYAAKCIWDHNPELEDLGENLYVTTGPLDLAVAAQKWFDEHEFYNYTSNECEEGQMCGHYTQVVWADSYKVGCAAHLCEEVEHLSFGKATILVCNYFPTGNFEGEKPYEEGESCSRCPEDAPRCLDLVCWPEEPEQEPSEGPDSTHSRVIDSTSVSPETPGTDYPLPPNSTPAEDSTPIEQDLPSPDPSSSPSPTGEEGEGEQAQAEASPQGTPAGEERAGGLPDVEQVIVDVDRSLEEAFMNIDKFLETQTPSSRQQPKEKVEVIEEKVEEEEEVVEEKEEVVEEEEMVEEEEEMVKEEEMVEEEEKVVKEVVKEEAEEVVEPKGRITVRVHNRNIIMSRVGQQVWSGVLLLIGLLACVTV